MMTNAPAPRKYDFIDALRGLAFLGVLLHHAAPRVPGLDAKVAKVAYQGHEGVELFFVLSALTLCLSFDARRRFERHAVLNFFVRRFFRIAPLFYCGAMFYFWFDRAFEVSQAEGGARVSLGCVVATLTFTNGWSVSWINRLVPGGWSIAVEMNFYLLFPLLFIRLRNLGGSAIAAFVALLGGALASGVARRLLAILGWGSATDLERFTWYWLPTQFPIFLLGFVLFFLVRPVLRDTPIIPSTARVTALFLLALCAYLGLALSFSDTALYLGHVLFGVLFVLLGWSLALSPNRAIVNPVMCYLGRVSFSSYLAHFAVLDLVATYFQRLTPIAGGTMPALAHFAGLFSATLAGTVLVSTLTHRLIEMPGQAIGRRVVQFLESNGRLVEPELCVAKSGEVSR
jgi:peptidoglycan/LPS O-acetylase OafA/YrhL